MTDPQDNAPAETTPKGLQDRRKSNRVAVEMFARERDGERLFIHPAVNLSSTGIFLESHSYSQRNAIERRYMELEFELPDTGHSVRVRGEVMAIRRVRGYSHGLAVRFLDLSDEDADLIDDFVERQRAEGATEGPTSEAAPTSH